MHYLNTNVLTGPDTTSKNGVQIDAQQLVSVSFQAVFGDSSAGGSVKIQMSNDVFKDNYQATNFTVANWTDIPNTSTTVTAGASIVITLPTCAYRWMRAVWTEVTPGTSTINVNMLALYP